MDIKAIFLAFFMLFLACNPNEPQANTEDAFIIVISNPNNTDLGNQDLNINSSPQELPGPVLNSILPSRSPLAGGIKARIIGDDFREPMRVEIGGKNCISLEIENPNRMLCELPPSDIPDVVDVLIAWEGEGGIRVLEDALTYYTPISITSINPNVGLKNGGTSVQIIGDGFIEATSVRFGNQPAMRITIDSPQQMTVIAPANQPGYVDISVSNDNGILSKNDAFLYQNPLVLDAIDPQYGSELGGDLVKLYGNGLSGDSRIFFTDALAQILNVTGDQKVELNTPAHPAGWANIRIENLNGNLSQNQAFLFLPAQDGPFQVLGLVPNTLSSSTGGYFIVGGNGFSMQTRVLIENDRLLCEYISPQQLKCFAPSHPVGRVEVKIQEGNESRSEFIYFEQPLMLYRLSPDRGAIQGGTLVEIQGEGFVEDMEILLDGINVPIERFDSSSSVWIKTPPHTIAKVSLSLKKNLVNGLNTTLFIDEAFEYFDALSQYGGAWGERIDKNLNVNVVNIYDFSPVEGVKVKAFSSANPSQLIVEGTTDTEGRVTLASRDLLAPIDVSAVKDGFGIYSIERLVSENLTIILFPFSAPPPSDGGEPPAPPAPVNIKGRVTGISILPKPLDPNLIQVAFVDVTHTSLLNRSTLPVPAPKGILLEDGEFEINTRPGQLALLATVVQLPSSVYESYLNQQTSYWFMRKKSVPIALGMIRNLSLSPGASLSDVVIEVKYLCDQQANVDLDNPSGILLDPNFDQENQIDPQTGVGVSQALNSDVPTQFELKRVIDFGPDGYFEWDGEITTRSIRMTPRNLPNFNELPVDLDLIWIATAENEGANPSSNTYFRQKNFNAPITISPMLGNIKLTSPTPPLSWQLSDPDFDLDLNVDGLQTAPNFDGYLAWEYYPGVERAEIIEPEVIQMTMIQNGLPVWEYMIPGSIKSIHLPQFSDLSSGVGILPGEFMLRMEGIVGNQRINYQDFNWYDLSNTKSVTSFNILLYYQP